MKLLEQCRQACQRRHFARQTTRAYLRWIEAFVRFERAKCGRWRHPQELGARDIEGFLTHLAVNRRVAEATQNQAMAAVLFLYRDVLHREVGEMSASRATRPQRLPTVLSRAETGRLLAALPDGGVYRLAVELMYGSGMRVSECCRLRVLDVDFERMQISIRAAKGKKDRMTMLPQRLAERLQRQIQRVQLRHQRDVQRGDGYAPVDMSLEHKRPTASRELRWQFVFPSAVARREAGSGRLLDRTVEDSELDEKIAGLNAEVAAAEERLLAP
ncbi:MAG TPA: phage integrase N-terminal SAM-like domain-containing protein [Pirellulales bacterium]|jgi:integrase|nr:phage integrase N-terminal SAM-like domain-containing protein [Pirellulales bacterium]